MMADPLASPWPFRPPCSVSDPDVRSATGSSIWVEAGDCPAPRLVIGLQRLVPGTGQEPAGLPGDGLAGLADQSPEVSGFGAEPVIVRA